MKPSASPAHQLSESIIEHRFLLPEAPVRLPALLLASLLTGPGPVKYRFESKIVTAVDLPAMGQGNQNAETSAVNAAKVATKRYTTWSVTGKEGDFLLLDATSTRTMALAGNTVQMSVVRTRKLTRLP